MPAKRGRLNRTEEKFIQENSHLPVSEIARRLNRSADTVGKILGGLTPDKKLQDGFRRELRNSEAWALLKSEFTPDELRYFEERWTGFFEQFREDVAASEQQQIMMAIKFEILISRIMKDQQRARKDIEDFAQQQKDFYRAHGIIQGDWEEEQRNEIREIEAQLTAARAGMEARSKELVAYETKHEKLMEDLKATRSQRVSRIESGKESFIGLIKRLQEEESLRETEGQAMLIMQAAAQQEAKRLAELHTYADGVVDQPLLNADTVGGEAAYDDRREE